MAQVVNNTDRLTFILTSYGLSRVAEALTDTSVNITLSKIKVGNANYEYYEPYESMTDLVSPIEGGEFYIIEKDLLEDQLTVSLHAIMPENFSDCEIREVGIYELVDNEDKLFAISTQQPLLKPSTDLNYFITVDYYAFLKSANLAEVYEQIVLDPNNQVVTQEDFDKLMRTVLFSQANLMEQINGNSRVIGLNRAQQLQDLIEENKKNFSYMATGNNYSLVLDNVKPDNVFSYWLFDYPRKSMKAAAISDLGKFGRNLTASKSINSFDRVYNGFTPMLSFTSSDSFSLPQTDNVAELDLSDFTIVGYPIISATGRVSNFAENNYITLPSISTQEGNTYSVVLNFYMGDINESQTIAFFETNYSIICFFDSSNSSFTVRVGNGLTWKNTFTIPVEVAKEYTVKILFDATRFSLDLLENGSYVEKAHGTLNYTIPQSLGKLVLGAPKGNYVAFKGYMKLMSVGIYENGVALCSGSKYSAINSLTFVNPEGTSDAPFSMLYTIEPLENEVNRTILARSNYSTNSNIFEISETSNNALKVKFFTDPENYVTFTSGDNSIPLGAHAIGLNYDVDNKIINAFVGGKRLSMDKEVTGTYSHMNSSSSTLYAYSYIETHKIYADSPTDPTKLINEDGTAYMGEKWDISNNTVFYDSETAQYTEAENEYTDLLYAWLYNDGLDDYIIYTKTLEITEGTILYNSDYTEYVGEAYKVVLSGSDYVITYYGDLMDYTASKNIEPKVLYCYKCTLPMRLIWSNSSVEPTVLYESNGTIYSGTEWYINDNVVYYRDGNPATYDSLFNLLVPTLPLTSYLIDKRGEIIEPINSNIGIISVVKEFISSENLRALTLNLDAGLGKNPCIREG